MITALVAAGRRPGIDPLAAALAVEDKALIEIAGRPMLAHVAHTLLSHESIGAVEILCQDPGQLRTHPAIDALAGNPRISFRTGGNSVSGAVSSAIGAIGGFPYLLTTADNVLLDHAMLDRFIAEAETADVAVAVVSRRVFAASFPNVRRTWLRFAGGAYSGANIFWFGSARAQRALNLWRTIEQDRKRGRAIVAAFGPIILIGAALRLLTIRGALALAGRRMGLKAVAVELPFPQACIDIDTQADYEIASRILSRRHSPDSPEGSEPFLENRI